VIGVIGERGRGAGEGFLRAGLVAEEVAILQRFEGVLDRRESRPRSTRTSFGDTGILCFGACFGATKDVDVTITDIKSPEVYLLVE
jgi:hypothetical protein